MIFGTPVVPELFNSKPVRRKVCQLFSVIMACEIHCCGLRFCYNLSSRMLWSGILVELPGDSRQQHAGTTGIKKLLYPNESVY